MQSFVVEVAGQNYTCSYIVSDKLISIVTPWGATAAELEGKPPLGVALGLADILFRKAALPADNS